MQEERIKGILTYLDARAAEKFSGGVRIGCEQGRPHSLAQTDSPDRDIPTVPADFNVEEKIRMACSGNFYGTLFFVFDEGQITHFCHNRTWQGAALDTMLCGKTVQPQQRRIAVSVKR